MRLIYTNMNSIWLFFGKQKKQEEWNIYTHASLEGCDSNKKKELEQLIESYKKVFYEH
jgi:hypothetical protein